MSKAGERLLEGAREAAAVAKGDKPAAAVYVSGHCYVPKHLLESGSITEIAARNPSVMDWVAHWEGRALKAEAALQAMEVETAEGDGG